MELADIIRTEDTEMSATTFELVCNLQSALA